MTPGTDKKKIFVIDDEEDMTILVGTLLGYRGFEVLSSNEPEKAMGRLLDESVDAIIVDLMMPGLDGFSMIGRLRESPRHGATPIIVLSSKLLDDAERKSLLLSKVRYVPKPVSPVQLVRMVRETLGV